MADIEKMLHQVLVDKSDRDIQTNVHLFGKVDSSCCCIWALHKTASDVINIIDRAKEAINDDFYMDDYLDSLLTIEEATKASKNVTGALKEDFA